MSDRRDGVPTTVTSIPLVDPHAPKDDPSIGDLVKDATTQVSTLVRAEVELAKAEITRDVKKGLTGSVFFILALVVLFYSTFFFFFFLAELLDTWAVASLTRSPRDGLSLGACGSTSGIEVTVVGTPSLRSLTEHFLPASGVSRVHVATWRPRKRSGPTIDCADWMVGRHVDGGWILEDQRPLPDDFRDDGGALRAVAAFRTRRWAGPTGRRLGHRGRGRHLLHADRDRQ